MKIEIDTLAAKFSPLLERVKSLERIAPQLEQVERKAADAARDLDAAIRERAVADADGSLGDSTAAQQSRAASSRATAIRDDADRLKATADELRRRVEASAEAAVALDDERARIERELAASAYESARVRLESVRSALAPVLELSPLAALAGGEVALEVAVWTSVAAQLGVTLEPGRLPRGDKGVESALALAAALQDVRARISALAELANETRRERIAREHAARDGRAA